MTGASDPSPAAGLRSVSPSVRAQAAAWLVLHPHEIAVRDLVTALQRETVPQVRRLLLEVLTARQRPGGSQVAPSTSVSQSVAEGPSPEERFDLAALVRHELTPAVGWIRSAANAEINDFQRSKTNAAVRKMQKRIDGLATLIKAEEELNLTELVLPEAILENWPDPGSSLTVAPGPEQAQLTISTDESLFSLLISNALQNAIDASVDATGMPSVDVAWGYTERNYWIRISNPFSGEQLSLTDVMEVGLSTKPAHQGQGLMLVKMVADRLGLAFTLEGHSGTASFSLSGTRSGA